MSYLSKPYKITEIKTFTDDIKLFRIKCNLNPSPGQFIEVSIPGVGECPLASCSYNKGYVDLLTKNAGNVTSAIFKLSKNEPVLIRGPYGKGFPIKELKNNNLIMIAGGTGIAPVTSLIDYVEKNRKDFKEVFIYFGFRDEKHILLKDKIKEWKNKFKMYTGLSEDNKSTEYEKGFIQEIIEKHKPKTEKTVALLCGPEIMMDAVTKELNKLGLKNDKIYWSMERRMECGFGSCGRCQIQDLYVCKDGPVFRYDIIKPRIENEQSANEVKG
jgi:sulfite reductase subunit B